MKRTIPTTRSEDTLSLARIGAEAAAAVFGQLCGGASAAVELRVCDTAGKLETGVVFEFHGARAGVVALLLGPAGCTRVLDALGVEAPADSALREVGNMLASHAVSAVADALGARVNLSVPTLVHEDAASVLDRWLARRAGLVVTTTGLDAPRESAEAVFVFAVEGQPADV